MVLSQRADNSFPSADRGFLLKLHRQALSYFLDNQMPNGLMLDRQRNLGPRRQQGLCSTAASGMGFIALALASAPPHRLLSPSAAAVRIRAGLRTALDRLPHQQGIMPHFIDSASGAVQGADHLSTIDSAWLVTGALWAAAFLQDAGLEALAGQLYARIDWHYWTAPEHEGNLGLIRHGQSKNGQFLACAWDRLNGETAFLYVLAAGASEGRRVAATSWLALRPFYGTVAGLRFNNADLGLFVFQYSLDLLDLERWQAPGEVNLASEARLATEANQRVCRQEADRFGTYRRFWGLSAGDGPGRPPQPDAYRCYAPVGPLDGTAHLMASLASVSHNPGAVVKNLRQAHHDRDLGALGRYGFSNVNVDQGWVGQDMVGIDAGAAVLALDNYLVEDRVRRTFHDLPCVRRGLERLGFTAHPHLPELDLARQAS